MRSLTFLTTVLLLAACASNGALESRSPFHPTRVPDRILLTWAADPATTQTVTWRTDPSSTNPVGEVAVATDGPEFRKQARRVVAKSTALTTKLGDGRYHTLTFEGLQPSTKYCYRVGDGAEGGAWSEWSHFTTASATPAPFSFVYFGDAQNSLKSHWSRVVREAFKDAPRASFLLHAGDLVNRGNSDHEWGEWFYSGGWIFRTMPSLATPGNHEYQKGELSRLWQPTFEFPKNGAAGLEDTCYYVDYQGARIISVDSCADIKAQAAWLDRVLTDCDARWTIVTTHYPIYSSAKKRDNPKHRAALQPLFDKHAVDLVLTGHDHTYGRTGLVRHRHSGEHDDGAAGQEEHEHADAPGDGAVENVPVGVRARSDESGTVYVVSVSGPKMYPLASNPLFVRAAQNKQLYQILTVEHDELRFAAYTAVGELFDSFVLKKVEGSPNELVEQ
ncbi:MAG: metallophosphoesterase family protein [bacterium]|nr:metallophosphoesterase family protein [bacterium]